MISTAEAAAPDDNAASLVYAGRIPIRREDAVNRIRRILAIARKELLVLLGERKGRFMVLIPPIMQLFIFAWAATMEVKNVDVVVLNQDAGVWSSEIINRLRGSPTFRTFRFTDDPAEAAEAVNRREALFIIAFQNDFSATVEKADPSHPAVAQMLLDGRRSNAAQIVAQYLQEIIADVSASTPLASRIAEERAGAGPTVIPINWFNPNLDFQWFILPNLIGTINFMMGILITGLTVARERELGTFDQMLVSPATPLEIAVGKLIPGCTVGLFHGTVFLLAAVFFFGVPFVGSVVALYAAMLVFSLSVSSLGLLVSSFSSTQQQAFLGCFTVAVPCILLSGFMTPINNMPLFLQHLSDINPLKHFIILTQGFFLKGITPGAALAGGGRIALIAAVSMTFSIWMFKRRV